MMKKTTPFTVDMPNAVQDPPTGPAWLIPTVDEVLMVV